MDGRGTHLSPWSPPAFLRLWVAVSFLLLAGCQGSGGAPDPQPPISPSAPRLSSTMAGYLAFGEGRYDEALQHFRTAMDEGSTFEWLPEIIRTVQDRARLGVIAPADTQHVGLIWVREIQTVGTNGHRTTRPDVSDEDKYLWRLQLEAVRATIEAFTQGHWTLAFEELDAVATQPEGSPLKPPNPDHLNLERYFLQNVHRLDSYIIVSRTTSPSMALARRYPLVDGVIYGPHRGMMAVSTGSYSLTLHEFFHTVEWVSGGLGGPTHGWREEERKSYPDWHGDSEMGYYRWHFSTTLGDRDWRTMNHTNRWRLYADGDRTAAQERILAAYQDIPLPDRQRARRLSDSARAILRSRGEGALALYREALALSPYEPESLVLVFQALRAEGGDADSLALLAERLSDVRTLNQFTPWDSLAVLGRPLVAVGAWWPEEMTREGAEVEWDITDGMNAPGTFEVTFQYVRGWHAADIDQAVLLEDGIEVARDQHPGFSGKEKRDNVYLLTLQSYRPGARYLLRARLAGVGGTDSHGIVLVRRR